MFTLKKLVVLYGVTALLSINSAAKAESNSPEIPGVQGILQTAPTITSVSSFCATIGTNLTIDGTNFVNGGTSVSFNGVPATTVTFVSTTRIRAVVPAGAAGGPITVTTSGGSAATTTNFHLSNAPTVIPSGPTSICLPADELTLTSSRTGGEYIWQRSNNNLGIDNISVNPTQSGTYRVRVVNDACTSSWSPTVSVTVNTLQPTPTVTPGGPVNLCTGGSARLTSSATSGNRWSTGATSRSITTNSAGEFSVRVVQGACTTAFSNSVTVNTGVTPSVPTLSPNGPTTFCSGGSVVLSSSTLGDSYIWQRNNVNIANTADSLVVTQSGNYRVRVISGSCTSAFSPATTVTVNTVPSAPTVTPAGPIVLCGGATTNLTSNRASGNIWSTEATTQSIVVSSTGTYSVRQVVNGCTSAVSNVVAVTANSIPAAPTISANGPTTLCNNAVNLQLTSSTLAGNIWTRAAAPTTILGSGVAFRPTITGLYRARVIAGGCTSAISNEIQVTINTTPAIPTINVTGATTFCQGGSVSLESSRAGANLWSTGQTTRTIAPTTTGSYTVRGVNANCTSAASLPVEVVVVSPSYVPPILGRDEVCPGDFRPYTSTASTGYLWNNGANSQTVFVSNCQGPDTTISLNIALPACTSATANKSLVKREVPTAPTVTPASGNYPSCFAATVTNTVPGATILFTTNGNLPVIDPTNTFTRTYTSPVGINQTTATFRARSFANGCLSATVARFYTIDAPCVVNAPSITPGNGSYEGSVLVTINSNTPGATVYFTTVGSLPVIGNGLTRTYTEPFWLSTAGLRNIKAISVLNGVQSTVASVFIEINNPTLTEAPVLIPGEGSYVGSTPVSMSSTTPGSAIYWTNNGATPTVGHPFTSLYTGPVLVTSSRQLKAMAVATGLPNSSITVANYTITAPMPGGNEDAIARKGMEDVVVEANAAVFPNPSKGVFNLQVWNPNQGEIHFAVIDLQGREIQSGKDLQGEFIHKTIDLTQHKGNMFFIKLMIDGKAHTFKLTKN